VAVITFGYKLNSVPSKFTESINPPVVGDLKVSILKPKLVFGIVLKGFTKLVAEKLIVVPEGHSGLLVQALEIVILLTSVESDE